MAPGSDSPDLAGTLSQKLDTVLKLPPSERVVPLAELGRRMFERGVNGSAGPLIQHLVQTLESGAGTGRERLELGEVLGLLGDPRLHSPGEDAYWVPVKGELEDFQIGRFPVTNQEFFQFVANGGYDDASLWSDEGRAWLAGTEAAWPAHAARDTSRTLVVGNQPVVGVSWYEAEAYANAHGARLPRADERVWVVRGPERRPYPWGAPFGEGNANTREEVLGRPCAVGLYVNDRTPEGVCDLAGNVAEWTADRVGAEMLIHPGAWDQPSMAAWAKALSMAHPSSRWAGLGFRLVRPA